MLLAESGRARNRRVLIVLLSVIVALCAISLIIVTARN